MKMIDKKGLKISRTLYEFINDEVIPGTSISVEEFWNKFSEIVHDLAPINKALIQKREDIQKKLTFGINQIKKKILTKSNTLIF